jgi:hypothetical protein
MPFLCRKAVLSAFDEVRKRLNSIMKCSKFRNRSVRAGLAILAVLSTFAVLPANGQVTGEQLPEPELETRISNKVAEFSGIDKITGRIIKFDVYIDETVQFGALQVTPRVCYSRPITQKPKTTSFIEVDEITLDRKIRRIFTGWMFADSPGLNAVEHPVYDIWLNNCKMESDVAPPS